MRTTTINQFWVIIFALFLFNGCKAPEAYRAALDAFSQGAVLEMKEKFPEKEETSGAELPNDFMFFDDLYSTAKPLDPSKAFTDYYKEALTQADVALKGASQLEKGHILDNAYAIKALILWRQNNYDAANEMATKAEPLLKDNSAGEENDVRDLAMMQALPGLVNIENAYQALAKQQKLMEDFGSLSTQGVEQRQEAYEKIKGLYKQYVTDDSDGAPSTTRGLALIERAIENVDDNSAIVIYLRNAQLAAVDTWGDMLLNVFTASRRLSVSEFAPAEAAWVSSELDKYEQQLNEYLIALEGLLNGGADNKLYQYWKKVL